MPMGLAKVSMKKQVINGLALKRFRIRIPRWRNIPNLMAPKLVEKSESWSEHPIITKKIHLWRVTLLFTRINTTK